MAKAKVSGTTSKVETPSEVVPSLEEALRQREAAIAQADEGLWRQALRAAHNLPEDGPLVLGLLDAAGRSGEVQYFRNLVQTIRDARELALMAARVGEVRAQHEENKKLYLAECARIEKEMRTLEQARADAESEWRKSSGANVAHHRAADRLKDIIRTTPLYSKRFEEARAEANVARSQVGPFLVALKEAEAKVATASSEKEAFRSRNGLIRHPDDPAMMHIAADTMSDKKKAAILAEYDRLVEAERLVIEAAAEARQALKGAEAAAQAAEARVADLDRAAIEAFIAAPE